MILLTPYIKETKVPWEQYTRYCFPNMKDWVATIWFVDNYWKSSFSSKEVYNYSLNSKQEAMEWTDQEILKLNEYIFLSEDQFEKYKTLL
jgi:hypothetical protein